jgi:hypothetical protein
MTRVQEGTPQTAQRASPGVAWLGLCVGAVLLLASFTVPNLLEWEVFARLHPEEFGTAEPLHGFWSVNWLSPAWFAAVLLGLLGIAFGPAVARRLAFPWMVLTAYAVSVAFMFALAWTSGADGVAHVLDSEWEYYAEAPYVESIPRMISTYIERIPYEHPEKWSVHAAGHPPGALLFFVILYRLGFEDPLHAGIATSLVGATSLVAVLLTLRLLGAEQTARTVAPFLAFTPALIFVCVSGDGMFAAFAAWGLAALAAAATASRRGRMAGWSVVAGLLLGYCVMLSYGLPLLGLLAVAVLIAARGSWWPMPIAAVAALGVVLTFVAFGFAWWEAYPVLVERYWSGAAKHRPFSYWVWGNFGALLVSAGPMVASGVALLLAQAGHPRAPRSNDQRVTVLLAGAALLIIVIADLSRMSKSEVERIWLPFIPWLTLSLALLPPRWRTPALAVQVGTALVVETLLYTTW